MENSPLFKKDIDERIEALKTSDTEWLTDDDMTIFSRLIDMVHSHFFSRQIPPNRCNVFSRQKFLTSETYIDLPFQNIGISNKMQFLYSCFICRLLGIK